MNITNNSNTVFKSGLNLKTCFLEHSINPSKYENIFKDTYGIETSFLNNKSIALANTLCANIFVTLARKFKMNLVFPPVITAYNYKNLIAKDSASNFCIPDTKEVLNNDYPYPGRSIFFINSGNFNRINEITEYQYRNKKTSSSHFLSPFIHEWLHSLHLDYIYNKFGYGGDCDYLKKIYPKKMSFINGFELLKKLETKTLTTEENNIIFDILGEYSTKPQNQYLEICSETFTKFICDSLNGTKLVKNPFELLKKTPVEFQNILYKICQFR